MIVLKLALSDELAEYRQEDDEGRNPCHHLVIMDNMVSKERYAKSADRETDDTHGWGHVWDNEPEQLRTDNDVDR